VPGAVVDELMRGFAGAALTTLPDGRVALSGGPSNALVVFDPRTRTFSSPGLIVPRAFHAAIATGDEDVLLAGGCASVDPTCQARRTTALYHLNDIGNPVLDTTLPTGARVAAQLFDLGVQLDGRRRYLLAGGTGDLGRADRFALGDDGAEAVRGGRVQPAALDGGAVLTAFADDAPATAASGAAAVYAPEGAAAAAIAKAPDLKGVRLIALEDGRVVGFGGDTAGRVLTYDPTRDAWTAAPGAGDRPGPLTAPSLARLIDGTVLVIDGTVSSVGSAETGEDGSSTLPVDITMADGANVPDGLPVDVEDPTVLRSTPDASTRIFGVHGWGTGAGAAAACERPFIIINHHGEHR